MIHHARSNGHEWIREQNSGISESGYDFMKDVS
jgi:hypothetical protein